MDTNQEIETNQEVTETRDAYDDYVDELKSILVAREFDIRDEDRAILKYEVKRAIQQINRCRRYTPSGDNLCDEKYVDLILPLCVSSFAKIGAEGQKRHAENGIVRNYTSGGDYPIELLREIIPLVK